MFDGQRIPIVEYIATVLPYKAEVSTIENYRRGGLFVILGWQSELMDQKVVGVVFLGVVAMVTSPPNCWM